MLPRDFLTQLADRYELSPEQKEAFIELFSRNDNNELEASEALHISHNAFRTRMTGVYSKFSIRGKGPGKYSRLLIFLTDEYQKYQKSHPSSTPGEVDIDATVQQVREKLKPGIQERCGTIRVLDMAQPIELNNIYTNVNILEKISGRRRLGIAELLQGFDPEAEEFDRFGLGKVSEERVPGLEAVERHSKLMVLGKPGAGKTTFLKYLAIQCICSEFQASRVPIYITLKQFAETRNYPKLVEFIIQDLGKDAVTNTQATALIECGRALLLLDGLDEVREEDSRRVIRQIEEFSDQYRTNQFVITCRIAAREYTFEQFTEVEVADFDDEQIKTFVTKWFREKESDAPERFMQQLELNKPIKELATNPLLLTLLCLEFEDSGDFPSDRAELYNRAIHTLLRKWDTKRGIVRDEVYKKLSVRHKEDLLSEVAWTTFERKDYFFKQRDVERYIADYIRNLPDAQTDPDALQLDSEAVLKSIEAQHGLLVERARGIYSFSHLTFQEYFTAREIVFVKQSSEEALQKLVPHITKQRWREVFLLAVGISPSADRLLQLMKHQIDSLLVGDEKLQQFLTWVERKSHSVEVSYKPAAVRAFYFTLALALDLALARDLDLAFDTELQLTLQQLRDQLPDTFNRNWENFNQWWQANGQAWVEQLKAVMIQYRNIGHDWQFSDAQKNLLRQYYGANRLLVDCLNSDCYVNRKVRQSIEDSLLLPGGG